MTLKFNPPPGWPPPPAGWTPPDGWRPDPSWPVPPAGWPLWVDDSTPHPDQHHEMHGAVPAAYPPGGFQVPGMDPRALGGPTWQAASGPAAPPMPPVNEKRRRLAPWFVAGAALTVVLLAVVVAVMVVNQGPSAPTGVAASAVDGSSVSISWTPPANGTAIDRYVILRDASEIGSVPGSESTYLDDDGLSPANTYTYSVVAVSESRRSSPSPELSVTPMAPSPSALTAVKQTTTSIVLGWDPPASSPTPDQYLVFRNGEQVATVAGSEPTFADSKLTPATGYEYTIAAAWGSRTSEASEVLSLKTKTPPLSAARLTGSWPVQMKMTHSDGGGWPKVGKKWDAEWDFTPKCDSGPCSIVTHAQIEAADSPFTMTLTRKGTDYSGSAKMRISACRGTSNKDTVTIRLRVTKAEVVDGEWVATGIKGTLSVRSPYISVGGGWYCPTQTHAMSVTGTSS